MDAKSLREAMKQKAKRLCGATSEKVDASTFTPAEPLNADVKTGARPVSRRAFKVGGKVAGAEAMTHAGRTPRKSGGKTEYANALVNRNVKDANEEREGIKHVGGFAKGGVPEYNEESVEKAIQSSRQKIGKKESSTIKSLLQGRKASMPMKKNDDGNTEYAKGGRIAKMGGGPMDPKKGEGKMTAPLDHYQPLPQEGRSNIITMDQADEMMREEMRRQGDMTRRKHGGKIEGSAKDMMEDKKMAAKMGMTMKEWEASHADKMHDMPSRNRTKKMGGGSMDADDEPRKGPYHIVHQKTGKVVGKANTLNGARKSRERNDMDYGSYAHQIIDTATGKATMKDGGRTAKMGGGSMGMGMGMQDPMMSMPRGYKKGGKAEMMHHKDCMCKACGGAAMAQEGGRNAKMSGGSMGYAAGGKMKMVEKDGKKVPFFAADGVGKMAKGGGLYANIHAKRERIEDGSKEKMRKPGSKGAPSASDFKDAAKTAKKNGGEAMHHKDCMCKACGGAAMSEEGGRMARKSGGKVGKSNISINIYPHSAEKPGAGPMPPMGAPPMPPMPAPMMKPPMPAPSPMPSAPPPAHMSLPPGLQQALAGAAGAGPMPPAGGGMPSPMMNRPPMPAPMMGRKAGGRVEYPITGGAGGGRARKEKVDAYGEKMNKDLRK